MSTDISYVRNNPFILNDSRYGSNGHLMSSYPKESQFHGYNQVSHSASCSSIQQRLRIASNFEPSPPQPVAIKRRFRLVSEDLPEKPLNDNISGQLLKQTESNYSQSIHSVASYDKMFPNKNLQNANNIQKQYDHEQQFHQTVKTFEGRLEHSQSHGAISQYKQFDIEPLKLDLNENLTDWKERQNVKWKQHDSESPNINDMEYGPGIVQKLKEKFSKMASSAIEKAQISPHAKQKKFPSVDDILSDRSSSMSDSSNKRSSIDNNEYIYQEHQQQPQQLQYDTESYGIKLINDDFGKNKCNSTLTLMNNDDEPRAVIESSHIPPISALRAKFEQQSRHSSFRPNFNNQRSRSVSATSKNSTQTTTVKVHDYQQTKPQIPETRPKGNLPKAITPEKENEYIQSTSYPEKKINTDYSTPKPVRVMDFVNPPADPTPKRYEQHQVISQKDSLNIEELEPLSSPGASSTSTDGSPLPEEPISPEYHGIVNTFEAKQQEEPQNMDISYKRTQTVQDERSNERQYFTTQKQKMTLTLPIGGTDIPLKSSSTSDIKIGKPGSTPITGPNKLKVSNDDSGISEVQKLLNRFSHIREQKMQDSLQSDAIKKEAIFQQQIQQNNHQRNQLDNHQHLQQNIVEEKEKHLPTAIVPPVPQNTQQESTETVLKPYPYPKPPKIWDRPIDLNQDNQKNIINISIGQMMDSMTTDNDETNTENLSKKPQSLSTEMKHRHIPPAVPPPPPPPPIPTLPPLPPKNYEQQRKSLTSKWLETKEASSSSSIESDDGSIDRRSGDILDDSYVKPYGDDEIIESNYQRRSFDNIKEESDEEIQEEVESVKLISHKDITDIWKIDENNHLSRSDFLKSQSKTTYDSSESEEDEHPHLTSYNIHRLGLYDPSPAADGNPVRHSLLSLVAEEDIPELLQAMAEEHHFVFDDCDNMPTTSGIIHTSAKRLERKKERKIDRIKFVENPPEVFAYVDETTAYEEGEWFDGVPITYNEYKEIVEMSQQEQAEQHMQLARWRQAMELRYNLNTDGDPVPEDKDAGVTNTISYDSSSSSSTNSSTNCGQPLQYTQADRGTSAI